MRRTLLLDEHPLVILPSLACVVGLDGAIILQQLHYWLRRSGKTIDGRKWIYNSYESWAEQFPFWSVRTVRRILTSLESEGVIKTAYFNKTALDRTKWYTIDYDRLYEIMASRSDQIDKCMWPSWPDRCGQLGQMQVANLAKPIPETNTETNTETNESASASFSSEVAVALEADDDFAYIVKLYESEGFGLLSEIVREELEVLFDEYGAEWLKAAMKEAVLQNKRRLKYVRAILQNWRAEGGIRARTQRMDTNMPRSDAPGRRVSRGLPEEVLLANEFEYNACAGD